MHITIISIIIFAFAACGVIKHNHTKKKRRQAEQDRIRNARDALSKAVDKACKKAVKDHDTGPLNKLRRNYDNDMLAEQPWAAQITDTERMVREWHELHERLTSSFLQALDAYRNAPSTYDKLLAAIRLYDVAELDSPFIAKVVALNQAEVLQIALGARQLLDDCVSELTPKLMSSKDAFEQIQHLYSLYDMRVWRYTLKLPRPDRVDAELWRKIVSQHVPHPDESYYSDDRPEYSSSASGGLRTLAVTALEDRDVATAKYVLAWCNSIYERHLLAIGTQLAAALELMILQETRKQAHNNT